MPDQLTADGATAFTQTGRILAIDSPLGKDVLLLTSVEGEDRLSRCFVYTIEFGTLASDADVRNLIGQRVTIWLQNHMDSRRPINGFIRRVTGQGVALRGHRMYRAELVPRLWFLDCTADCRIFQDLSYPDIVKAVFAEYGVTDCQFKLTKSDYPVEDYCVQYRETALAFVSRLLEHVGIFYYHEHTATQHSLIITDANQFTGTVTPRKLQCLERPDLGEVQRVWTDTVFQPGNWALSDYDFEAPSKLMQKNTKTHLSVALMPQHEWFDFPGGYTKQDVGTWLTRVRMEAEEAHHSVTHGTASISTLDPGRRFDLALEGSGKAEPLVTYLLTEVRHHARETAYFGADIGTDSGYNNDFEAIVASVQYRPERTTPKAIVRGSQTATVVSLSAGDPILTDEYGRVKVHFHWDRRGKRASGATSCWLRVSQNSAGAGFGGISIPHAGQEVVVDFLEGDPDRPLIVGRVHNAEKITPINLPADKHKTITRDHGGNKIIMNGAAGKEHLTMVSPASLNLMVLGAEAKPLSAEIAWQDPPSPGVMAFAPSGVVVNGFVNMPGLQAVAYSHETATKPGQQGAKPGSNMNLLSVGDISSLSHQNTNSWAGNDSASWVGRHQWLWVKRHTWHWHEEQYWAWYGDVYCQYVDDGYNLTVNGVTDIYYHEAANVTAKATLKVRATGEVTVLSQSDMTLMPDGALLIASTGNSTVIAGSTGVKINTAQTLDLTGSNSVKISGSQISLG